MRKSLCEVNVIRRNNFCCWCWYFWVILFDWFFLPDFSLSPIKRTYTSLYVTTNIEALKGAEGTWLVSAVFE